MATRHIPFSERYGHVEAATTIQIDDMSPALRNRLHNVYLRHAPAAPGGAVEYRQWLWDRYFKGSLSEFHWSTYDSYVVQLFQHGPWYRVYDFLEVARGGRLIKGTEFAEDCNDVAEEELGGYRFVGKLIVPISSPQEIAAIEGAVAQSVPTASTHLRKALELLAVRPEPNCAKVINEAILAVEAEAQIVVGDTSATLGQALGKLKRDPRGYHPAMLAGFGNLYGWTSDGDGIRHAGKGDTEPPDLALATLMVVNCSAMVSYLEHRRSKL